MLFAAMGFLWGIPYLLIKIAVEEVSAPMVVLARTAVGAAVLLPLAMRGGQLRALAPYWKPLTAFALIEIAAPWLLLSDAERHLSSSMAGLLIAASPIVTVVIAKGLGASERLGAARSVGLGIGLAGVAVLAAPELRGGSAWAVTEMLLVAVCYGTAPQIVARRLRDVPALPMTAVCLAGVALLYVVPAGLTLPDQVPSIEAIGALIGLGLVCTALAFVVFFALIQEVGAERALVFTYLNPAVAVTAGVLVLGERLHTEMVIAFALILVGSVLATRPPSRRPDAVRVEGELVGTPAVGTAAEEVLEPTGGTEGEHRRPGAGDDRRDAVCP